MIIQIRDLLRDLMPSGRIELPNPYEITANPEAFLDRGFAVVIKERALNEGVNSPLYALNSLVSIVLTNGVRDADLQVSSRLAAEEALYADAESLTNDILQLYSITSRVFLGDGGIEYLDPNKHRFLKLELNFEFIYKEALN